MLRTRLYLFGIGVVRHMTLGTRVALIADGRVFLIRQTYLPGWHFPGGGVEPGETAATAAAREMEEETGFRATGPLELRGLHLSVTPVSNRDHIAFFICREAVPAAPFRPNHEVAAGDWFALDALPADATPPTQRRIAELRDGLPPDAMW